MNEYNIQAGGCDPEWHTGDENDWSLDPIFLHLNILVSSFHFNKLSSPPLCERRFENCSCWRYKEKELGALEKPGKNLQWCPDTVAQTGSWGLMVNICQLCIQWYHIGSLKLANIGECILRNWLTLLISAFSPHSGIQLLNIYQHSIAFD